MNKSIFSDNSYLSYRNINAFLLIMAITAMSFAYFFLQSYLKLELCPLCVFQRVGVVVMGIFTLLAVLINPKKLLARLLLWLGSFAGILWSLVVAIRHVWIQHLPADEVPSCGPGLDFLLDAFPLMQVLKEVFSGSGECAEIAWQFLGLSIPEQTLILFSILTLVNFYLLKLIISKK